MIFEGKRGLSAIAAGVQSPAALGPYSDVLTSEVLPKYYQAAKAGLMFHFSSGSITAATANLSPLPAGTMAPIFAIGNPVGSGKDIVIVKTGAVNISGTPAGPLVWNTAAYTATTATVSTPVNALVGGASSVMKVWSGQVLTGSLVGVFYRHAANFIAAAAAGGGSGEAVPSDTGGDIIIPEGYWAGIGSFGAGTTHVYQVSVTWLELPA